MPADLSREEIDDYGISLVAGLLSGVQAERLLAYIKNEPTRIDAARQEGYREGVEACAVRLEKTAADHLTERDHHMRAWDTTKGSLAEDLHARRACSAEATAASLSDWAAELRRLSPPPAEPSTTKLGHTDLMVSPEAIERVLAADADGWIEWKGGECPVAPQTEVEAILRSGGRQGRVEAARLRWDQPGWQGDIVSYRIVKPAEPRHEPSPVPGNTGAEARREPAEPSAPVAPEGDWPAITQREVDGVEYALTRDGDDYSNVKAVLAKLVREKSAARITALEAENAALKARNVELVEGLRPFAKAGGEIDLFAPELRDEVDTPVAIGDLRRARALLQGGPDAR